MDVQLSQQEELTTTLNISNQLRAVVRKSVRRGGGWLWWLGAVAMGLTVACKRTPETGVAAGSCAIICEVTRPLACAKTSECVASCREIQGVTACKDEMASLLRCFAREPIAHWECNPDGEAALKNGLCNAEQKLLVTCAQAPSGVLAPPAAPAQ